MTSSVNPKTILLKGSMTPHEEGKCGNVAIRPGMLIERNSANTLQPHGTAGGRAATVFARENSIAGQGIDDDYVANDRVLAWHVRPGDEVYALLEPSANIAVGAKLESAGDGQLQAASGNFTICEALEAVNSTGAANFATRIRVRIL